MDVFGKRHSLLGGLLSVAPDWYVWLWSYALTTGSAVSVVCLTRDLWTSHQQVPSYGLVFLNQLSSLVLLLSDPGIYPRGQPRDEPPPESSEQGGSSSNSSGAAVVREEKSKTQRTYCRQCCHYRPPRASHCYVCGVCVLDHDHHCVLLGVCIGRRSQRWFVLYLITTTLQLYAGMFFLILSFRRIPSEEDWKHLPPPDGARAWSDAAQEAFRDQATFRTLYHLVVMGVIALLMLPVTAGTIAYVLLPLTNTTWREAQNDGIRLRTPEEGRRHWWFVQVCVNLGKMMRAGPSLLSRKKAKQHTG